MRTAPNLGLLLVVTFCLVACGNGKASLGGAGPDGGQPDPAAAAPACALPKSWSDPSADGVVLTTEPGRAIDATAVDGTHAYYVVHSGDGTGATELKRVSLDGGASETLATLGQTEEDHLALRGDAVLFVETEVTTGRRSLVSVPKAGGARSVLVDNVAAGALAIDTNGDAYLSLDVLVAPRSDDVLAVRVNEDGSTTPAIRAPKDVAPYGIRDLVVAGGRIAWVPEQSEEANTYRILGDMVVYVTDAADPASRLTAYGPYSDASIAGLAMDERNVYFGVSVGGLYVADVKTPNSETSFGPQVVPNPYAILLDRDTVYWQTLIVPPYGGIDSIARAPKEGGAADWLVDVDSAYDAPALAVGDCVLVWRARAPNGDEAIFMRPKSAPGRDQPTPSVQGTPTASPSTP